MTIISKIRCYLDSSYPSSLTYWSRQSPLNFRMRDWSCTCHKVDSLAIGSRRCTTSHLTNTPGKVHAFLPRLECVLVHPYVAWKFVLGEGRLADARWPDQQHGLLYKRGARASRLHRSRLMSKQASMRVFTVYEPVVQWRERRALKRRRKRRKRLNPRRRMILGPQSCRGRHREARPRRASSAQRPSAACPWSPRSTPALTHNQWTYSRDAWQREVQRACYHGQASRTSGVL